MIDKNRKFFNKKKRFKSGDEIKKKDRIVKRLSMLGFASRREAEKLVLDGKVKINNIVCKEPYFLVGYDDKIVVNGKEVVNKPIRTQVFLMNKPSGYVTTNNDPQGRRTIFELIPDKLGRLITIGRLDFNTEGLLLLTNNGELARVMEMPVTGLKRVYYARVIGKIDDCVKAKLANLKNGIKIEGTEYGKMIVEIKDCSKTQASMRIVIFEGKNNEIRRVMWHFGLKVVKLTRVQYGDFFLKDLPSGCVRKCFNSVNFREIERKAFINAKKRRNFDKKSKQNEVYKEEGFDNKDDCEISLDDEKELSNEIKTAEKDNTSNNEGSNL